MKPFGCLFLQTAWIWIPTFENSIKCFLTIVFDILFLQCHAEQRWKTGSSSKTKFRRLKVDNKFVLENHDDDDDDQCVDKKNRVKANLNLLEFVCCRHANYYFCNCLFQNFHPRPYFCTTTNVSHTLNLTLCFGTPTYSDSDVWGETMVDIVLKQSNSGN